MNTDKTPSDNTPETNKDKLQTAFKKSDPRFSLRLHLDIDTTRDLLKIQHSPHFKNIEGKKFSRSTLMRRALMCYCNYFEMLCNQDRQDDIDIEFAILMEMSKTSRHSTKQAKRG
jgi:hypothetical protein